ncbi:MAG: 2,3-bisphosphoglycerate-independent phosphoglycerate mutase [Candidatus Peribacteraceae bacterium]|nr:2,3-bisphosphoglycerate-independent phosphoglycerate mutase [Candidatus Peribacteraceae bacterium]
MARCALIIIDGFGVAPPGPGNARTQANLPNVSRMEKEIPNVLMEAAGNAAGLPEGQQGASEQGHYTIGAGRVVWQTLEQINRDIRDGSFFDNEALVSACKDAVARDVPLHFFIIFSYGGVHGHANHLYAAMKLAKDEGVKEVCLHLTGDGRDVPEQSLLKDIEDINNVIEELDTGKLCSVVGRYYSMDRDLQWDRTKVAYDLYTQGVGEEVVDFPKAFQEYYSRAEENQDTDYYMPPLKSKEFVSIAEDHVVVNLNYRTDRQPQITEALTEKNFEHFDNSVRVTKYVCMGPYSDSLPIAYPELVVKNNLGSWLSQHNKKQLRVCESEKYAHVTFFFNSQEEDPYPGEERIKIPSPKCPSYDQKPEMSASKVTDAAVKGAQEEKYDMIVVNYANPDLVGHSGDLEAAIIACETVDAQLEKLLPELEKHGYEWIITSDHGNSEQMLYDDGKPCPSHTDNLVQTFVNSEKFPTPESLKIKKGIKDIAPMCLEIMDLEVPEEMKG